MGREEKRGEEGEEERGGRRGEKKKSGYPGTKMQIHSYGGAGISFLHSLLFRELFFI